MNTQCNEEEVTPKKTKTMNTQYKNRVLIEEKMATLLIDSHENPSKLDENGIFFIKNNYFAVNRNILSQNLGITVNALNKDFRHHEIKSYHKFPTKSPYNLIDQKGWKIFKHSNEDFNLNNILNKDNKFVSKWTRNSKKVQTKNEKDSKTKSTSDDNKTKFDEVKFFDNSDIPFEFSSFNSESDNSLDFSDFFTMEDNAFTFYF